MQRHTTAAFDKGWGDQRWKGIRRNALGSAADPAEQFGKMGKGRQFARVSVPAAISTETQTSSSRKKLAISNRGKKVNPNWLKSRGITYGL
jgi:hypothetical protein